MATRCKLKDRLACFEQSLLHSMKLTLKKLQIFRWQIHCMHYVFPQLIKLKRHSNKTLAKFARIFLLIEFWFHLIFKHHFECPFHLCFNPGPRGLWGGGSWPYRQAIYIFKPREGWEDDTGWLAFSLENALHPAAASWHHTSCRWRWCRRAWRIFE